MCIVDQHLKVLPRLDAAHSALNRRQSIQQRYKRIERQSDEIVNGDKSGEDIIHVKKTGYRNGRVKRFLHTVIYRMDCKGQTVFLFPYTIGI